VERIRAPILLISGSDDRIWPAGEFCAAIVARLKRKKFPYEVSHLVIEGGGHSSCLPFLVTANRGLLIDGDPSGGSPKADARGGYRSWAETIAFLQRHSSCLPFLVTANRRLLIDGDPSGGSPRADVRGGYRSWAETMAFLSRHLDGERRGTKIKKLIEADSRLITAKDESVRTRLHSPSSPSLSCWFQSSSAGPRPDGFPVLKGPYLGQKAPGIVPALFAPLPLRANETWFWHGSPSFSADGGELYFVRYIKGQNYAEMMRLLREKDDWRAPERASFSSPQHRDNNPFFAGDGSLYFYSARFGGSICRVVRRGDTWSPPEPVSLAVPAGKVMGRQFSITSQRVIYAELWTTDDTDSDLYRWEPVEGRYPAAEKIDGSINTPALDFMPFIDPEETFLLFCSNVSGGFGQTDIYASFRNADGTWTRAQNLGPDVNSAAGEAFPFVSTDGKFFFFCREGTHGFNPYWVDLGFIKNLRPKESE
jgi:hypothetical protein